LFRCFLGGGFELTEDPRGVLDFSGTPVALFGLPIPSLLRLYTCGLSVAPCAPCFVSHGCVSPDVTVTTVAGSGACLPSSTNIGTLTVNETKTVDCSSIRCDEPGRNDYAD
jgi:hypothetical protein